MGWLTLVVLLTIVITAIVIYVNRDSPLKWYDRDEVQVAGIMTFILSFIFVAMFGAMYTSIHDGRDLTAEGCREHVNRWEIVSAVRDKEFNSSFILGTGGGTTVDRYYVYQVEPEGMMLTDYNANRTFVVEQDGTPRYERIDTICPMPIYDFLWWSSDNTHRNINRKGTLYVPHGTILREFRM